MNRRDRFRTARTLVAAAVLLGSLGACTSGQSGGGPTGASVNQTQSPASVGTTSTTPGAPAPEAECTKSSIEGALPKDSVVVKFGCAIASPAMWAAARVEAGSVFFLTSVSGPWKVTAGTELCGAKIKKVPKDLRGYCG